MLREKKRTKKITKGQITVIAALTAALLLLAVGILLERILSGSLKPDEGNPIELPGAVAEVPPYQTLRNARISLGMTMTLETNLGGSGDETVTEVFAANNMLYIFGNSDSSDFDMEGGVSGAFLAIVDEYGRTNGFTRYTDGYTLAAVILAEGGFLLALHGDQAKVMLVDYAGTVLLETTVGEFGANEMFCALRLNGQFYTVITSYRASTLAMAKLRLLRLDRQLNVTYERNLDAGYSMTFLEVFSFSNRDLVFFHAQSDLVCYTGVAECSAQQAVGFSYLRYGEYTAHAVMPYAGGYVLSVIRGSGEAGLLCVGFDYKNGKFILPADGIDSPTGGRLYFNGSTYYTYYKSQTAQSMTAWAADLSDFRTVRDFSDVTSIGNIFVGSDFALFACQTDEKIKVLSTNSTFVARFGSAAQHDPRVVLLNGGVYVVAHSDAEDANCGGHFGGTDVWVVKLAA